MQRSWWPLAAIPLSVVAAVGTVRQVEAQARPVTPIPAPVSVSAGRWQIVNGAPEFRNMVMLLDTATGQTWVSCVDDGAQGWCKMFRSESGTAPKVEK